MTRHTIIVRTQGDRDKAKLWCDAAPVNMEISFKANKRSVPQNKLLWSALTDLATQLPWHGVRLTPEDYKLLMLDAWNKEMRIVPNVDGNGFVNLGRSSSELTVAEMTDLITVIHAFGGSYGVVFSDTPEPQRA